MMKVPTQFELDQLSHGVLDAVRSAYDPVKAHEYYERHKKLKGRKPGQAVDTTTAVGSSDPRIGKHMPKIHSEARAKQRKELAERIQSLSKKLAKLEAAIRRMVHEEASEDRKGKAKKERAAKEKDKPKSAAEKAESARESKKYRSKHKQELKTKAKKDDEKSDGSSGKKHKQTKAEKIVQFKLTATRVRGQIAVAKQKLAAL